MQKQQSGFTLIELMIVIAIAGILASIAIPSYRSYIQQATVSKAFTLMQEAKIQVSKEFALTGNLPASQTDYYTNGDADADIARIHFFSGSGGQRIVATFGPANGELNDRRLWLELDMTDPKYMEWECQTHRSGRFALPDDALPGDCVAT